LFGFALVLELQKWFLPTSFLNCTFWHVAFIHVCLVQNFSLMCSDRFSENDTFIIWKSQHIRKVDKDN
jgi:hypothetical protein